MGSRAARACGFSAECRRVPRDSGREPTELSSAVTLASVESSDAAVTVDATGDDGETTSMTIAPAGVHDTVNEVDGLLTWRGQGENPSAVVQPIASGLRIMSVFSSASAPTEAEVSFDAGEKITPTFFNDGALVLHSTDDDTFLGLIESPWAVDANGAPVKTWSSGATGPWFSTSTTHKATTRTPSWRTLPGRTPSTPSRSAQPGTARPAWTRRRR